MKRTIISLPKRKKCGQDNPDDDEKQRLSIAKCREILKEEGQTLTDEEILKIRDYLYYLATVGWEQHRYGRQQAKLVNMEQYKTTQNEESHYLRAS